MRTKALIFGLLLAASTHAQLLYHDASAFPLLGKATDATLTRYERLPASLKSVSRKPLWDLGRNSAGLALRFRSNSTCIGAKWEVRDNRSMNHMTPAGIKGLDLYCLQDGKWVFAGSGRPQGKVNEATIVKNMDPEEREEGQFLTGRFSPGYGDYPIAVQNDLLRLLDAPRKIGLCATPTHLLTPRKSVTAVLGVAGHPVTGRRAGCANCALRERCAYRKEGKTCE